MICVFGQPLLAWYPPIGGGFFLDSLYPIPDVRGMKLKEATKSFAREFVGLNPTAVAYTKLMFNSIDGLNYRGQMERGQDLLVGLLKSPNLKEVLDARDEDREPSWK